jgi:hypothetical protein
VSLPGDGVVLSSTAENAINMRTFLGGSDPRAQNTISLISEHRTSSCGDLQLGGLWCLITNGACYPSRASGSHSVGLSVGK